MGIAYGIIGHTVHILRIHLLCTSFTRSLV